MPFEPGMDDFFLLFRNQESVGLVSHDPIVMHAILHEGSG